jgi:hypothetical protein
MIKINPVRNSMLILFFCFLFTSVVGQNMGSLKIKDIRVVIDNKEMNSADISYPFEWNKDSKEYLLYAGDNLSIVAKYKITTYKSSRSSLKNSALNVIIRYYTVMDEKKSKRRSEKIFYLDQKREFNVDELFTFKNDYNTSSVKLTYTAELIE